MELKKGDICSFDFFPEFSFFSFKFRLHPLLLKRTAYCIPTTRGLLDIVETLFPRRSRTSSLVQGSKKGNPSFLNTGRGGSPLLSNLLTIFSSTFRRSPLAGPLEVVTENELDTGASVAKVKFHTLA
ncbi:hypothetical protein ACLOJK_007056 [Asimina triloba]